MFLVIDQGNTNIKGAIVASPDFCLGEVFSAATPALFLAKIAGLSVSSAMICSVAADDLYFALSEQLSLKGIQVRRFTTATTTPILNAYTHPETLGSDRLADAVGAWSLFPHQHSFVIDCGSCLNYELVASEGIYLGGGISPGLQIRLKAMHDYTGKLPLLNASDYTGLFPGKTTKDSMLSATIGGMIAEIEALIEKIEKKYTPLNIILAGGDASFFGKYLKNKNFAHPDLVLTGLAQTLKYHFETK
ncbi:MAG: type III pantothenate kinase [Flavobacteriales bacterium]|nr:type III pantothenate kinase [Flavobacteriales bacterium]